MATLWKDLKIIEDNVPDPLCWSSTETANPCLVKWVNSSEFRSSAPHYESDFFFFLNKQKKPTTHH